jgi:hypothetical protein
MLSNYFPRYIRSSGLYYDKKDIHWTTSYKIAGVHVGEEISTLHDGNVIVWAAVTACKFCWSHWVIHFKLGGEVKTVNIDRFIQLLQNKLIPALHRCGVSTAHIYFLYEINRTFNICSIQQVDMLYLFARQVSRINTLIYINSFDRANIKQEAQGPHRSPESYWLIFCT